MAAGERRNGVVTAGTWCADHNKIVPRWPGEDDIVEILSEEVQGGGSACNLGIGLKRLDPDFPVCTIGLVGDDEDGRALLEEAGAAGIDCSRLRTVASARTAYTDAFASGETGRRTHLYHAGTSALITPDDIDFSSCSSRILHLGLPGVHARLDAPWQKDANGWVTVLKKASAAGIDTNMELCSIPPDRLAEIVLPCLPYLNLLIINDFEIAALSGSAKTHGSGTDAETCIAAARAVLDKGAMRLIVVHFPDGAIALTRGGSLIRKPSVAVPADAVVGANGAGDAFAAGTIYGIHEGWNLEDSIALGHASAAASLRSLGTTAGIDNWRTCLELASEWGWRDPI